MSSLKRKFVSLKINKYKYTVYKILQKCIFLSPSEKFIYIYKNFFSDSGAKDELENDSSGDDDSEGEDNIQGPPAGQEEVII